MAHNDAMFLNILGNPQPKIGSGKIVVVGPKPSLQGSLGNLLGHRPFGPSLTLSTWPGLPVPTQHPGSAVRLSHDLLWPAPHTYAHVRPYAKLIRQAKGHIGRPRTFMCSRLVGPNDTLGQPQCWPGMKCSRARPIWPVQTKALRARPCLWRPMRTCQSVRT